MYFLKMAKLCVGKRKGDFNTCNFDLTDDLKVKALKSVHVMSSKNPNLCKCTHKKRKEKGKENDCTICLIVCKII